MHCTEFGDTEREHGPAAVKVNAYEGSNAMSNELNANNVDQADGCESEENLGGPVFEPRLYIQRYSFIQQQLIRHGVKSVVDFGCAECKIAWFLTHVPSVERIVLVDIDRTLLELNQYVIRPLTADYLHRRKNRLHVALYAGSVTQYDDVIGGVEAVTLVEVIEHLYPDVLSAACEMIFGQLQPRLIVMTTPNSEFNQLFPGHKGFRHWDHKFEWTRQQFQIWCKDIMQRYPDYRCEFTGVGSPPTGSEHLGFCSQAAIFVRTAGGNSVVQNINDVEGTAEVDGEGLGVTCGDCVSDCTNVQCDQNDSLWLDDGKTVENKPQMVETGFDNNCSDDRTGKHLSEGLSSKCAITSGEESSRLLANQSSSLSVSNDIDVLKSTTVSDGSCSTCLGGSSYTTQPRQYKPVMNSKTTNTATADGCLYPQGYELISECNYPYQDTPEPSVADSLLQEVKYLVRHYQPGDQYLDQDGELYYQVPLSYIITSRKIKGNFNQNQLRDYLTEHGFELSDDNDHVLVMEEYSDSDLMMKEEEEQEEEMYKEIVEHSEYVSSDKKTNVGTFDLESEECWDS